MSLWFRVAFCFSFSPDSRPAVWDAAQLIIHPKIWVDPLHRMAATKRPADLSSREPLRLSIGSSGHEELEETQMFVRLSWEMLSSIWLIVELISGASCLRPISIRHLKRAVRLVDSFKRLYRYCYLYIYIYVFFTHTYLHSHNTHTHIYIYT